jgi:predicted MFS family arabinose efflux permease
MHLAPYRHVLSLPGLRRLVVLGFLTRIPTTAIGIGLTLHVVNNLHRSYAAAGLVTAAYAIGGAVGSPLIGRLVDRRGARPALAVTTLVQTACWFAAPHLGYQALAATAAVGGLLAVPVWGIIRQSLTAQVPEAHRRPAFALDSMSVEVSFMIGPAAAVALSTGLPGATALNVLAVAQMLAGIALYVVNPMTRAAHETRSAKAPARRSWLRVPVFVVLMAACVATFILSSSELTIVATLRQDRAASWTGLVIALWCAYSLVGGLVFGTLHRPVPVLAMVAAMGLLTIPAGLAPDWRILCLLLIPAGALCAPTITAANDTLSRLVPADSRGEAMGLLGSALTVGNTIGAPFAGLVIDGAGPGWAFAAAGAVGTLAAALAFPAYRLSRARAAQSPAGDARSAQPEPVATAA